MKIKRKYNYCCLFNDECDLKGKTVVREGTLNDRQKCKCGKKLKQLGEAINVVLIGTQESLIKK
jgi:hypothetical protein